MDDDEQSNPSSSDSETDLVDDAASIVDESDDDSVIEDDYEESVMDDIEIMSDIPVPTKQPAKRGRPKQTAPKKKGPAKKQSGATVDSDMDEDIYRKIQNNEIVVDSSDDEEDNEDAEYQKLAHSAFRESISQTFTVFERPGKEEIEMLTTIHRDKDNNICDPTHTTIPWLTNYERARVLSIRVAQLDYGAIPLVPVPPEMKYTNYMIAVRELEHKKLSFVIQRPLPDNRCEYWKVEDLQLIS